MADNDKFCLRLNSFDENVLTAWKEMQMEEDFCDITLACQDNQIKTHKLIISSYSPVLRDILKSTQSPHPFIYLRRVKYRDLQNVLTFMYQGEVNVPEEDLSSFLEVAEDLNIRGLSERNMESYGSNEDPSNSYASPKRNRSSANNEHLQNISGSESDHSMIRDVQEDKSFVTDGYTVSALIKNKKITNPVCDEGRKQNIISTFAGKQFYCEKCDKQYSSHVGLLLHSRSVHEGVKYSCHKCEYKAKQQSALKMHVKSIHEGLQYPCNQCEYKATQISNLRTHQLKHHKN